MNYNLSKEIDILTIQPKIHHQNIHLMNRIQVVIYQHENKLYNYLQIQSKIHIYMSKLDINLHLINILQCKKDQMLLNYNLRKVIDILTIKPKIHHQNIHLVNRIQAIIC
jgi:hypothetical protein